MNFFRAITLAIVTSFLLCSLESPPVSYAQSNTAQVIKLTFTTIDAPGALNTVVEGINNVGQMVGYYYNDQGFIATGFELDGGNFSFFSDPIGYSTVARAINDSGLIAGYSYVGSEGVVGYLYDSTTFTKIQIGSYPDSYVAGIDNAGDIVGGYGFGSANGFEQSGTKFRNVTPPGGQGWASADGINNFGQIVGWSYGNDGFFYQNGKYTVIKVTDQYFLTEALGINDNGMIVGSYFGCTSSCTEHGFVFFKGKYLSFDFPNAFQTFADGINNAGQVVGTYTATEYGYFHGFVTSPVTVADFQ